MQTVTGSGGGERCILEREARGRKGAWLALLGCTRAFKRIPTVIHTIHPDVYYIHIYAQRTPTQREKWVYCSPVSLQGHTWFQNHAEKKYIHRNGTKVASAHLRLIFVCVCVSLFLSFSLSFSRSLPSSLSLHISSLPSLLHTLSLLLHSMVGRWEVLLESSAFCSIWAASKGGWL